MGRWWTVWICACLLTGGCVGAPFRGTADLPQKSEVRRERLVVHSNFEISAHHRLMDELVRLQDDVVKQLDLPKSESPIDVYLFETAAQYRKYIDTRLPEAPERRACFVHRNDELNVFAHWSEFVMVDLRHEVTHGYLHAVVDDLPLWLDEGLAEYFEVGRDAHGFNLSHRRLLQHRRVEDDWRPDLAELEKVELPSAMGQLHYAESWAWVHFLLETTPERRKLLRDYIARLRMDGKQEELSQLLLEHEPNAEVSLLKHLRSLQP